MVFFSIILFLEGCSKNDTVIYNLNVESKINPNLKIHIATFDSDEGENYRKASCNETAKLLQENSSGMNLFYCEQSVRH